MASREELWRRFRGARSSRSRTTSDFEILRPRDSRSMSATRGSGSRTVRVFMKQAYYIYGRLQDTLSSVRNSNGSFRAIKLWDSLRSLAASDSEIFFQTTGDLTRWS